MAACAAEGQQYGTANCTGFRFPSLVTQRLSLVVDDQGFTRIVDPAPAGAPAFYPAVNFTGTKAQGSDAIGSYVVDWLVRGASAD